MFWAYSVVEVVYFDVMFLFYLSMYKSNKEISVSTKDSSQSV